MSFISNFEKSNALFNKAKSIIPGGVNSPVRAFKAVGGNPLFINRAEGAYLIDEDGNRFVELINSWGPMILGHAYPPILEAITQAAQHSLSFGAPGKREVEMAELITSIVPSVEKVRMVNSGTEATMAAVRVARGFTGRNKIIKFEGCYHGHGDSFLIAAGSGVMTMGTPDSPGVPQGVANDTLTAKYNSIEEVRQLVANNKNQIAAIIIEPVVGNMGCVLPEQGFLENLRTLCTQEGIVFIFDEVMTGFRLSLGGAQELFGVYPDMTTFGKIIGGGMPVGAYGGKKEIMDCVAPAGPVYQAGTLSGNPVAMAAGIAMLTTLKQNPQIYAQLEETTQYLCKGMMQNIQSLGLDYTINQIGSMFTLFFTSNKVNDYETAKTCDTAMFGKYFQAMLKRGVYLAPSQFESMFISTAITKEIADFLILTNKEALQEII
ncbi:MAG: glutamate-1-semialdehyde-2,1-aminomutase [Cytophagales bacterium]|nr:MAG: glutamate-1-semialdehyde-2,1-aminomutase [Cytophagales bacterium]